MNFPLNILENLFENDLIIKKQVKKWVCFGLISPAMTSCIFCDIVTGKSPTTKIELETEEYVIFKNIKSASTYHFVCVTKRHIESLKTMTKYDIPLINRMENDLKNFFQSQDIDINDALFGFHMPPIISVEHLHMHGISPLSNMSQANSVTFKPNTSLFKTTMEARNYLSNKAY